MMNDMPHKLYLSLVREFPGICFDKDVIEEIGMDYGVDSDAATTLINRIYEGDYRPLLIAPDKGQLASLFLEVDDRYGIGYRDDGEFATLQLPTSGVAMCLEKMSCPNLVYFGGKVERERALDLLAHERPSISND